MKNHFSLLVKVPSPAVDLGKVMDHFGVTREDAHRICDGAGIIIDLTAPKLNYLMQKFGSHLELQVPVT